jgi:hypothetical protein
MSQTCFRSIVLASVLAGTFSPRSGAAAEEKVQLVISGGHETDPRDRGRPVALVAGGLGVSPEVFRSAFSRVKPAPGRTEPEPAQVRQNKDVLLGALARYDVTNDELDRVSNYYRYVPGRGNLWRVEAAAGYAVLKEGTVTSVVITNPGSGYNSPPTVSVPVHAEWAFEAKLAFGSDLKKNGSISTITPLQGKGKSRFKLGRVLPPSARTELNLTSDQEREIAKVEEDVEQRLSKILTAEQRKKLEAGERDDTPHRVK